jgi:hypothetical protein
MDEVKFRYLNQDISVDYTTDKQTHEGTCCFCAQHRLGNVHIVYVRGIRNDQGIITLESDVGKQITRYAMQNLGAGKLICDKCFRSGSKQVPTNF